MKPSDPAVIVAIITVVGALSVAIFNAPTVHHYFENEQPSIQALIPDKPSPIAAYSLVTWNAIASDREKDTIYYDFFLKGPSTSGKLKDMTGWTSSPNWTWATSDSDSGENTILVKANDLNHLNSNYSNQKDKIMIINIEPYPGDKNREYRNLLDMGRYQSSIDCYNSSIKLNPIMQIRGAIGERHFIIWAKFLKLLRVTIMRQDSILTRPVCGMIKALPWSQRAIMLKPLNASKNK